MITAPFYPGHLAMMPTSIPPGAVMAFAGKVTDHYVQFESMINSYGWMLCDGRTLAQSDYPVLYAVLGDQYNTAEVKDDAFCIPDYRGYFLRMADMGSGRDPDAGSRKLANNSVSSEVGSIQEDALQIHQHAYLKTGELNDPKGKNEQGKPVPTGSAFTSDPVDGTGSPGSVRTSTETRAKNVYVYYIIKFV
ncbi:tail fiber protein [Chitinophaga varians]|uniref:tail fiber protein n=1 Tax=Chitinophaga varians TaxID=2202339 RepID=UPI00165FB122|nr:phage tail protein [Chitinophaga varians]MBC9910284.1 tail fiber protein [Chitinophaga varians]